MATVTTTIVPSLQEFQLEIPTQTVQQNSGFPRSVVEAVYSTASYTDPGAGNEAQIYVTYSLPRNFAYAYLGYTLGVSTFTSNADNEFAIPYHEINGESLPGGNFYLQPTLNAGVALQDDPAEQQWRVFTDEPDSRTDSIVFNAKSEQPSVRAYCKSRTANTGTGNVYYRARFLKYDISQAYAFPVNYAIPTR